MSIINNANPGSSILIISTIDKYLREQPGNTVSLDTLKQHLRPATLPNTPTGAERYGDNLVFWLKLGLWQLDGEEISIKLSDRELSLEHRVLKKIIEMTVDQTQFYEGNGVEPFSLYITCLINQDQYSFANGNYLTGGTGSNVPTALLQYANLGNNVPNQSNEAPHFLKWAEFLGFVEPQVGQSNENLYFIDPTRAIFPYLSNIFMDKKTLSIQEFLKKLAEYLPMFGEGCFVKYLEPVLRESQSKQPNNQISAVLSHALLRFEAMNKISFEQKSDDINVMQLYLPQGMTNRSISSISLRDMT